MSDCLFHGGDSVFCSHLFIFFSFPETSEVTTPVNTHWPDIEEVRKLPFDPFPWDPKFRKASPVYSDKRPKCLKGQQKICKRTTEAVSRVEHFNLPL